MPRKERKKYNAYMKNYMKDYRAKERELIRRAKLEFGWKTPRPKKRRRKP